MAYHCHSFIISDFVSSSGGGNCWDFFLLFFLRILSFVVKTMRLGTPLAGHSLVSCLSIAQFTVQTFSINYQKFIQKMQRVPRLPPAPPRLPSGPPRLPPGPPRLRRTGGLRSSAVRVGGWDVPHWPDLLLCRVRHQELPQAGGGRSGHSGQRVPLDGGTQEVGIQGKVSMKRS